MCYACDQICAQVGVVLFDKALMLLRGQKVVPEANGGSRSFQF